MPRVVAERTDILPALAEVFREHGYDGASLALIAERTGLGKSSLYHFFPGGKAEMAAAVLTEIDGWFETNVFQPLRSGADPRRGIEHMLEAVERYFHSGRRVCVVGVFALGDARDRFASQVHGYFAAWKQALTDALIRGGRDPDSAAALSEECLAAIQGALVLARALGEPAAFQRAVHRLRQTLTRFR